MIFVPFYLCSKSATHVHESDLAMASLDHSGRLTANIEYARYTRVGHGAEP